MACEEQKVRREAKSSAVTLFYVNGEKTCDNSLLKYITPSDDVICACIL